MGMFSESIGPEKLLNLAEPRLGTGGKIFLEKAEELVEEQKSQPNSLKQ